MLVLVADDDPDIIDILSYSLSKDGHQVITAGHGREALEMARSHHPDLAILDVMMPEPDGFEVCRQLRQESSMPVILLTARGEESQKVWGLDLGADDYVTKPFSHSELRARVRAIGRRVLSAAAPAPRGTLEAGPLRMKLDEHTVCVDGRAVELTVKEYELLRCLLLNVGKVVSHETLINFVWGSNFDGGAETVRVHLNHLRNKLAVIDPSAPQLILNVRGVGYMLRVRG